MSTKTFKLCDVLSITTGWLVSDRHIGGVYDILGHMTGQSLFTHMLPAASDQCKPVLVSAFPELAVVNACRASLDKWLAADQTREKTEAIKMWIAELLMTFPEIKAEYEVPTLESWKPLDPIGSAVEMFGGEKVIPVVVG